MTSRKPREIRDGLQNKGFSVSNADHKKYILFVKGTKTSVWTKVSHGSKSEIGDPLLSIMARQLRLRKSQFLDLIDCPLSQNDYLVILHENDHI